MNHSKTSNEEHTNNNLNLSQNWRRIKQFARFDLIHFSTHAESALTARHISKEEVMHVLKSANSSIVQHHEPGTYNNNSAPVDVIFGKVNYKKKRFLHVVLATEQSVNDGYIIKVVTVYEPSKEFFHASGRVLRRN